MVEHRTHRLSGNFLTIKSVPDKKTSYIAASGRKTDFAPCIMREKTLSSTNSLSGCLTVHGKISYRFYHHHYHDHHNDDDDHHPSQSSQYKFSLGLYNTYLPTFRTIASFWSPSAATFSFGFVSKNKCCLGGQ